MNTTQLECFLSVANFLNFSRAAEQLRITQPAVSHQISTLEDELEVKLFQRSSKSVRLTQAGLIFSQYASEILRLSSLSKARLKECRELMAVRLGIGCRNFVELQFLRPVLARMRRELPQIDPVVRLIPFASLENLLEEEDVQVISCFKDSAPRKAVYQELLQCSIVYVCAPDHPLAGESVLTVRQMREGHKIAVCPPTVHPPALLAAQNRVISGLESEQVMFCDNLEIVYTLVEAGYAAALLPDMPLARQPGLKYIPVTEFPTLSYGVSYLRSALNPSLRQFLSILEDVVASD